MSYVNVFYSEAQRNDIHSDAQRNDIPFRGSKKCLMLMCSILWLREMTFHSEAQRNVIYMLMCSILWLREMPFYSEAQKNVICSCVLF